MNIDAHHHFWHYSAAEYGWISEDMSGIRRDFLPADLQRTIRDTDIDGVVSVQARQTLEETQWLLQLAGNHSFIRGVVGWVPLVSPTLREILDPFAADPKLKGVRHVIQGEPDDQFPLRPDFSCGIGLLREYDLTYDILIVERQLPAAIALVDRHPEQRFVLDHIAKPLIREGVLQPWAGRIRELAQRENVWCKLSGMVTEADFSTWTVAHLSPYIEVVLGAFGPKRVMFGSDWPVCLAACDYARWVTIVRDAIHHLSSDEQAAIMGKNACEAYRL